MSPSIKRILMTADSVGGIWTYTLEMAKALQEFGIHTDIAVMGPPLTFAQRHAFGGLDDCTLFEQECKLEWMDEPWEDVDASGAWLLELESYLHPDIVHLNGFAHGALPWRSPVLISCHSCVLSWYKAVKGFVPHGKYERYRRAVTRGLRCCNAVTAPTGAMLDTMKTYYGPFRAAAPIHNGRDASDFFPRSKKPFILSAGRIWDEAKNITALSRIYKKLPWPIFAAGPITSPICKQMHPEGITCLGRLTPETLGRWMGHASLYVLPARYEPFGYSVLEAAFAGCALVLGDIPSLREIWNGAALFAPPEDPSALLDAITSLINESGLREELAAKARLRAMEFTPRRMAKGYYALYKNCAYRGVGYSCPEKEHVS